MYEQEIKLKLESSLFFVIITITIITFISNHEVIIFIINTIVLTVVRALAHVRTDELVLSTDASGSATICFA